MADFPTFKLNDGHTIPQIGYGTGTAQSKQGGKDLDRNLVDTIKTAIKTGYTHLDGAEVYSNEEELGVAIRESNVPRSSLFVTTKIWDASGNISSSLDKSLKKLQLDYVDLYLIHAPYWAKSDKDLQDAWASMEEIQRQGKAKSVGVSNYRIPELEATLKTAKIVPAVNQVEWHPYLQREGLVPFSKKHGILTSAYGPQAPVTKAKGGPVDPVLEELAKKYGVTPGEVAIRFCIDSEVLPITTSSKEERLKQYLHTLKFKLTPEERQQISDEGKKKHFRGFFADKFAADDKA